MAVRKLKDGIYSVGAIDWDRRLFDELIPLPDGTTYNAYIIKGEEKTALLDTVDPAKKDELIGNLKNLKVEKLITLLHIMLNRITLVQFQIYYPSILKQKL